ncbi:hypothetical protein Cantr_04083 [Candida viswanathii]|uniref:CID domain-containing protein n=1 Tax=Candida viswanathii TaxID=5486 RepID=A0A367XNK9_9ASCO|nr:hypothetical protein Cantr_04083 [Candida viswanathii]
MSYYRLNYNSDSYYKNSNYSSHTSTPTPPPSTGTYRLRTYEHADNHYRPQNSGQPRPEPEQPTEFDLGYLQDKVKHLLATKASVTSMREYAALFDKHGYEIAAEIKKFIRSSVNENKVTGFYVIDAIVKDTPLPYTTLFAQDLYLLFTESYSLVTDKTRDKMIKLFRLWLQGVLFPLHILKKLEKFIIKVTGNPADGSTDKISGHQLMIDLQAHMKAVTNRDGAIDAFKDNPLAEYLTVGDWERLNRLKSGHHELIAMINLTSGEIEALGIDLSSEEGLKNTDTFNVNAEAYFERVMKIKEIQDQQQKSWNDFQSTVKPRLEAAQEIARMEKLERARKKVGIRYLKKNYHEIDPNPVSLFFMNVLDDSDDFLKAVKKFGQQIKQTDEDLLFVPVDHVGYAQPDSDDAKGSELVAYQGAQTSNSLGMDIDLDDFNDDSFNNALSLLAGDSTNEQQQQSIFPSNSREEEQPSMLALPSSMEQVYQLKGSTGEEPVLPSDQSLDSCLLVDQPRIDDEAARETTGDTLDSLKSIAAKYNIRRTSEPEDTARRLVTPPTNPPVLNPSLALLEEIARKYNVNQGAGAPEALLDEDRRSPLTDPPPSAPADYDRTDIDKLEQDTNLPEEQVDDNMHIDETDSTLTGPISTESILVPETAGKSQVLNGTSASNGVATAAIRTQAREPTPPRIPMVVPREETVAKPTLARIDTAATNQEQQPTRRTSNFTTRDSASSRSSRESSGDPNLERGPPLVPDSSRKGSFSYSEKYGSLKHNDSYTEGDRHSPAGSGTPSVGSAPPICTADMGPIRATGPPVASLLQKPAITTQKTRPWTPVPQASPAVTASTEAPPAPPAPSVPPALAAQPPAEAATQHNAPSQTPSPPLPPPRAPTPPRPSARAEAPVQVPPPPPNNAPSDSPCESPLAAQTTVSSESVVSPLGNGHAETSNGTTDSSTVNTAKPTEQQDQPSDHSKEPTPSPTQTKKLSLSDYKLGNYVKSAVAQPTTGTSATQAAARPPPQQMRSKSPYEMMVIPRRKPTLKRPSDTKVNSPRPTKLVRFEDSS